MASMSKRQQARNERELHDLLRVSGNTKCADCGASNPGWASWNLGIFLCMRCASIHRKLGTHISKVKSLSMDTWSSDQVENMKKNGNNAVNAIYNPKNRKPDMPLDADEVDSAMERFIRKKYQERSLLDGKPQPPSRDEGHGVTFSRPQEMSSSSPPPPLPPKKSKFFGFGLRASSSSSPFSKHDKKNSPQEPRVESAFRITSDDYGSSRASNTNKLMSEEEVRSKLASLRDMGFTDSDRNTKILRRMNGNVERTIEALIQLGPTPGEAPGAGLSASKITPNQTGSTKASTAGRTGTESTNSNLKPPTVSNNPFDQSPNTQGFGVSIVSPPQTQPQHSNSVPLADTNPWNQNATGLEQSFQNLHVAAPLFPHSTGGYPVQQASMQDPRFQYSMTPPVPMFQQQYGLVQSPAAVATTNPFFQETPATQQFNANPFATATQPGNPAPNAATNPFLNNTQMMPSDQSSQSIHGQNPMSSSSFNPFGIPPASQSPPQTMSQPVHNLSYAQNPINVSQRSTSVPQYQATNPFQSAATNSQSQTPLPNFDYGQPQLQYQNQPPAQVSQFQGQSNPFMAQGQPGLQTQAPPMMPQQTGRYDKNAILALYNYPQLVPQSLPSIPEPVENSGQQQQSQVISPAPSDPFSLASFPGKRSATMPISSMHSAGGSGSRNPFLSHNVPSGQGPGIVARHASAESISISNLEAGRHSPDAFASLSARYG